MNLQFLSGNPLAKRGKKRKAKKVASKGGSRMGSKKKSGVKLRKNPATFFAVKGSSKAKIGKDLTHAEIKALTDAGRRLRPRGEQLKKTSNTHAKLLGHKMVAAGKKASLINKTRKKSGAKLLKKVKSLSKKGYKIEMAIDDQVDKVLASAGVSPEMKKYLERKEKKMAKRKKAKKKTAKKTSKKKAAKKVAKKAGKKKASKKVAKKARKKTGKKRASKKSSIKRSSKKAAKRFAAKKKHGKKKHAKRKDRVVKRKFGRKIKSVKMSKNRKSLRILLDNPLKGVAHMAGKASVVFEQATGLDLKEAGLLVGAGASIGTLESLVSKYGQSVITKLPVQLQAAAPALLVGALSSAAHLVLAKKLGKNHVATDLAKALVAASVVRVASATLSSTVSKALGMSGVDFTPMKGVPQLSHINGIPKLSRMAGVDYTPMSGVDYTPMGNVNPGSMGFKSADFGAFDDSDFGGGGGYTEGRKTSKADFGGYELEELDALEDGELEESIG